MLYSTSRFAGFAALFMCATLLVGTVLPVMDAHAATYQTTIVSVTGQSNGVIQMRPGEVKEILVEFQNTSDFPWKNDGPGYISLYTHEPKYRSSAFDPGTWLWSNQVKRIREASVAPGEKATMVFELRAPQAKGDYTEIFHLASEDRAWMNGGKLTLNIRVSDAVPVATPVAPTAASNGIAAELAMQTANRIKTLAGRPVLFTAGFKNTGTTTWNSYGLQAPEMNLASSSSFAHPSWNGVQIASATGTSVKPGEVAHVTFAFTAPQTNGTHSTSFQFYANGMPAEEALLEIPVEVTDGSAAPIAAPIIEEIEAGEVVNYIEEPKIRVGVLLVDEETQNKVVITSLEQGFELRDTQGALLADLNPGAQVTAYYNAGKYFFDRGNGLEASSYGLRFIPKVENGVMRIANWDQRITRGATHADNEFRGVLELRYNDYKSRAWVINELDIEMYLRGLAETSDHDHADYNKAQLLAARSYAYFHMLNPKRSREFMDLNSTPSDQYYQGYGREKRAPNFTKLQLETAGEVVMYQGKVAITPYYARSNGATKNWSQVWWGDQPHVRGVSVPCDIGKTQWGHGVGMPQSGAECMAEAGKTYKEIINYFYTGIEIDKLWK